MSVMPMAFEDVVKMALELSPDEQRELAGVLLHSVDEEVDPEVEAAWDAEIRERIRAIDEGREEGIPHEDVMRAIEERLKA
jgi:putative addiction module component (TIGR02574 family)